MEKLLVIRHISHNIMLQYVDHLVSSGNFIVDVVSTTEIPSHYNINKILLCENDLYFNLSKTDEIFFKKTVGYDYVVIFQNDFRLRIPDNIFKFTMELLKNNDRVMIIDDKFSVKKFYIDSFEEYFLRFKEEVIFPKMVSISISDKCNLRCSFCYREAESSYEVMSLSKVKEIPGEVFENAVDVELSGYGEILVNREIFDIIEYVSGFNSVQRISFTTNAVMMKRKVVDTIMSYKKINLIQISIDSLRKDIYERIRKGANFETVMGNIKYLSQALEKTEKGKRPSVYLKMVLTKDTIEDLPEMVRFADEINADRLIAFPMHISKESNIDQSLYFRRKEANAIYDQATNLAKILNVSLSIPPHFDMSKKSDFLVKQFRDYAIHPCTEPYDALYIQANGELRPCCFSSDSYGNIFSDGIKKTWFGRKYSILRETVNSKNCPQYCNECGMMEDVDNIAFLIRKGDLYKEKALSQKVEEYIKINEKDRLNS